MFDRDDAVDALLVIVGLAVAVGVAMVPWLAMNGAR
jgi:hypothetical protein